MVFRERSSRKTVSYEEQIMSKDKYPKIFSPQMEAIVFIILQIFFAKRAVLKIGECPRIFPRFSWGIFAHVTRLDQSRASENIWRIITQVILAFWLVLVYDLSEDRCTIDAIFRKFFPLCLKMVERFENLDNILLDWAKDKYKKYCRGIEEVRES